MYKTIKKYTLYKMAAIELPEVELNIYSPKQPAEVTIVENFVCTAENSPNIIRHITFDLRNRLSWEI